MTGHCLFLKLCLFALTAGHRPGVHAVHVSEEDKSARYEAFRQTHRNSQTGASDPVSYGERLALFYKRLAEVEAHNADPTSSWEAEVNMFADYTDEEYGRLLNYRRTSDYYDGQSSISSNSSAFLQQHEDNLAEEMDWRRQMPKSNAEFYNQGSCGSCWATAAATVLQMHAEVNGLKAQKLSYEQITSCTPNPKHCGGDGGCKGATSALALNYVVDHVLAPQDLYPNGYQHGGDSEKCNEPKAGTGIRIGSYKKLAENEYDPLFRALAQVGPVVVSIAANGISSYKSGVYDGCDSNAITNHAVVAVGYGNEKTKGTNTDYWLLRNSWGKKWGMDGSMHMARHDPAKTGGNLYCGTDTDAFKGVACIGDAKEVPVCGMCGVLSHAVYPEDIREEEMLPGSGKTSQHKSLRSSDPPASM